MYLAVVSEAKDAVVSRVMGFRESQGYLETFVFKDFGYSNS